ncbi:MAG: EthD family reductase [Chloroflexi bacterium]|nr:EthD family reductase [Chloroflexota bacterium]
MHKLVILFDQPIDWQSFEQGWQKFMALAEKMPGLRKETVSEVGRLVFGSESQRYLKIHELYFDSREALEAALQSEAGQAAGKWLHEFSHRRFALLTAEHKEALPKDFKQKTRVQGLSSSA